jgi:hypothetical protein
VQDGGQRHSADQGENGGGGYEIGPPRSVSVLVNAVLALNVGEW